LSAAAYGGGQGPRPRPHPCLRAICAYSAVAEVVDARPFGPRAPAVARGPSQARRPLRMHPFLLLLDRLSELLVEFRQIPWPGDPSPGLSVARRQPRRSDRRAARPARGPVPPLSLPHDHELRERLPEGPQSG